MNDGPVWLDVRAAAARALVSSATILREARAGRLTAYKVGGRRCWRFRPDDVDRWLMGSTTPVPVDSQV
jgi:excisionase family DNA binding protein